MANEFATIAIGGTLRVSLIAEIGKNRSLQAFRENIKSPTDATSAVNVMIGLRKAFPRALAVLVSFPPSSFPAATCPDFSMR